MIDVKRLRLLLELSRRGTIAAVAQALSYSPSAVSQQLAVLEREAGTALLEPVGRRVQLTAAGELLAAHGHEILAAIERAESDLATSQDEPAGTVRLAAFQSAALSLVPDALLALGARHPGLRVEVSELEPEESLPALAAGELDLAVAEEYPGHPTRRGSGLTREHLVDDALVLATPAAWGETTLTDLAGRPFAMEPVGTTSRTWSESVCRHAGFEPDVRITSADLQVHLRMVEHGLAAALLPELSGATRHPGVRITPLPGHPTRQILTVTRASARSHPGIRTVIGALSDAVRAAGVHSR